MNIIQRFNGDSLRDLEGLGIDVVRNMVDADEYLRMIELLFASNEFRSRLIEGNKFCSGIIEETFEACINSEKYIQAMFMFWDIHYYLYEIDRSFHFDNHIASNLVYCWAQRIDEMGIVYEGAAEELIVNMRGITGDELHSIVNIILKIYIHFFDTRKHGGKVKNIESFVFLLARILYTFKEQISDPGEFDSIDGFRPLWNIATNGGDNPLTINSYMNASFNEIYINLRKKFRMQPEIFTRFRYKKGLK